MASIRLSITFDSKKPAFSINPLHFPAITTSPFPISTSPTPSLLFNLFSPVKVSRIHTELFEDDIVLSAHDDLVPDTNLIDHSKRRTRNKSRGAFRKWVNQKVGFKFNHKMNDPEQEIQDFLVYDGEFDVNYGVVHSKLSLQCCNFILKRLEKCSGDSKTLSFFEWMRSNGKLEKNVNAYNVVLRVFGRREDWETAERLIREVGDGLGTELDFRLFNTLIYACSKKGDMELGGKWFRMMLELGVKPNIATFGMLMGLYQKGWNVEEAEFVFSKMRSFGVVCQSAYSAMITTYTRLSLYDKAEEVIGLMREDKVVMNMENWLVLLNAYSQQGRLEEAEQVLVAMKEARFSPNIVAYNILITGYGKLSNMTAAQRLFLEIQNVGLEPNETTYRSMVEGWRRSGNYQEAEWYYKELKRLGFKPNSSNLYTLINLQAKHGDEEDASRTIEDMLTMGCQYSSIGV